MQKQGTGIREQGTETKMQRLRQIAAAAALAGACLLASGCRQDMQDQPKFFPQRGTSFYSDGRSVRPQVEGTVARGQLHEDAYFYSGLVAGKEADLMPYPVNLQVLERGQERFNTYCSACHSRVGNGLGMIVQRGYKPAGNMQSGRLLAAPLGHYFVVMSHGYGAMPDYAQQLAPVDRWAVAAYMRALQLSQNAKAEDVPAGQVARPLGEVAEHEGLAADFAAPWKLPPTAVYGTPNGTDNAILPAIAQPVAKGPAATPASK
jgi:cytochrome c553